MKAELLFHEKRLVINPKTEVIAVAEIKIWEVPRSEDYPQGRKFSLFLVSEGKTVIGIDNHKPKGPHQHKGSKELSYSYEDDKRLLDDFWTHVKKEGFEL